MNVGPRRWSDGSKTVFVDRGRRDAEMATADAKFRGRNTDRIIF